MNTTTIDTISLKQKLSSNLCGHATDDLTTTVMYMAYRTIEANRRLRVNHLKAMLCVEYLIKEDVLDGVLSGLISRSMFACVKRWRDPDKTVGDMNLSVTEPPPPEFSEWLRRAEEEHPEFAVFTPPIYQRK